MPAALMAEARLLSVPPEGTLIKVQVEKSDGLLQTGIDLCGPAPSIGKPRKESVDRAVAQNVVDEHLHGQRREQAEQRAQQRDGENECPTPPVRPGVPKEGAVATA